MDKSYTFFFHFNKPYSQRHGTPKWSVHYRGKCYICDHIVCRVPTQSKINKRQPYVVMKGFSNRVVERKGIVTIN